MRRNRFLHSGLERGLTERQHQGGHMAYPVPFMEHRRSSYDNPCIVQDFQKLERQPLCLKYDNKQRHGVSSYFLSINEGVFDCRWAGPVQYFALYTYAKDDGASSGIIGHGTLKFTTSTLGPSLSWRHLSSVALIRAFLSISHVYRSAVQRRSRVSHRLQHTVRLAAEDRTSPSNRRHMK